MEPVHNNQKEVLKGVFILSIGAVITKVLSAGYRVPFQNMVKDDGFYIYQQVYPFYGLALVLATSGFPVIISKIYAEKKSNNQLQEADRFLVISFLFLFMLGIGSFLTLYFGAGWLAGIMQDEELVQLFEIISFLFLILPFIAVTRGYFQGNGNMLPTAVSQVGEQIIRVTTILLLTYFLLNAGASNYVVVSGATFGAITGALISFLILGYFWRKLEGGTHISVRRVFRTLRWKEIQEVVNVLSFQGLAVCITGLLLIFLQMADSLNLYRLLTLSGIEEGMAKTLKGIYDRGQPLLQFGTIIATSLALSIVPLISSDKFKKNKQLLYVKIQTALKLGVLVGAGGSIGLFFIIEPTNMMLFENNHGSNVLAIISLLIFLCSVIITISGILQGLGHSIFPAVMIVAGFVIKYLLNIPLVLRFGTAGAAISSVVAMFFVLILLIWKLRRKVPTRLFQKGYIKTIAIAGVFMGGTLFVYLKITAIVLSEGRLIASFQALSAVLLGGAVYLVYVIRRGILAKEELLLIPLGDKLLFLLPNSNGR